MISNLCYSSSKRTAPGISRTPSMHRLLLHASPCVTRQSDPNPELPGANHLSPSVVLEAVGKRDGIVEIAIEVVSPVFDTENH